MVGWESFRADIETVVLIPAAVKKSKAERRSMLMLFRFDKRERKKSSIAWPKLSRQTLSQSGCNVTYSEEFAWPVVLFRLPSPKLQS